MSSSANEETPVPGTAAEDGRRKHGAYEGDHRPVSTEIQAAFYARVTHALSVERLEAYASDQASPTITLARYLLNLALCESLYSPLQLCEVALRNSLHQHLTSLVGREDWFDAPTFALAAFAWQRGYGAFSVGPSDLDALRHYIDGQEGIRSWGVAPGWDR